MSPKVSVIMSVYNAEPYLAKSIDSILNQTLEDFEFIIIDDCSTDNSYQIIENFAKKDARIKVSKKEKNIGLQGFIQNLNLGIQNAKGKYIARMDNDDLSTPERFQKQFDFLENHDEVSVVGSQLAFINEKDEEFGEKIGALDNDAIYSKMLKDIQLFHPALMYRNNGEILYREKMLYCEDYDLYLRLMSEKKQMANLPEKLLKYRKLDSSMSRRDNKIIRKLFLEKAFEFYRERQNTGKDSYDSFDINEFLKIYDENFKPSIETMKLAQKTALKYNFWNDFKKINQMMKKLYPESVSYHDNIISALPEKAFSLFSKINNKLS